MANKYHRKGFKNGKSVKRDFPSLRDSKKTFKDYLEKKGVKKLDFDDTKKSYKIFTKK